MSAKKKRRKKYTMSPAALEQRRRAGKASGAKRDPKDMVAAIRARWDKPQDRAEISRQARRAARARWGLRQAS